MTFQRLLVMSTGGLNPDFAKLILELIIDRKIEN